MRYYFFITATLLLQSLNINIKSQEHLLFYNSGEIQFEIKKSSIDSISFSDNNGILQDSMYLLGSNILIYKEALNKIDSIAFYDPINYDLAERIDLDKRFSIFNQALIATGLDQKIKLHKDYSYNPNNTNIDLNINGSYGSGGSIYRVPLERYFGYTAFIERDSTYNANNIYNLEDLKAFAKQLYDNIYPDNANISDLTNPLNSLNCFVAYHLVEKKLSQEFLIKKFDNTGYDDRTSHSVKAYDMFEYLETMCPNTLLEIRTLRTTDEYNLINMTYSSEDAIRLTSNFDNEASNGYYHEIDKILSYSNDIETMLSSKRLRFDFASLFSELSNNNMRIPHASDEFTYEHWIIPNGYIKGVNISGNSTFEYLTADDRFINYQGDAFIANNLPELTITTLPIPKGTYEIRLSHNIDAFRPVTQLYVDNTPVGYPVDYSKIASDPDIGYEKPGDNPSDVDGYINDKNLRNHGFMKGPASFEVIRPFYNGGWYNGPEARNSESSLRKIIGTFTFNNSEKHTIGFKALTPGELMFDYIEFVPISSIEQEGID